MLCYAKVGGACEMEEAELMSEGVTLARTASSRVYCFRRQLTKAGSTMGLER